MSTGPMPVTQIRDHQAPPGSLGIGPLAALRPLPARHFLLSSGCLMVLDSKVGELVIAVSGCGPPLGASGGGSLVLTFHRRRV